LDLGGDSIRSVRMVALAKKRGLNFTIQQVFHNQTIAELEREFNLHGGQTVPQVDTASFERSGMPWLPIVVNNS